MELQFSGTSEKQTGTAGIFHQQQSHGLICPTNSQAFQLSSLLPQLTRKILWIYDSREKQTKIKVLAFRVEQLVFSLRSSKLFIEKLFGYRSYYSRGSSGELNKQNCIKTLHQLKNMSHTICFFLTFLSCNFAFRHPCQCMD